MAEANEITAARQFVLHTANMPVSGDYAADCATGRDRAQFLMQMQGADGLPLLPAVCREMIDHGEWSPTHVGFFHAIGEALCGTPRKGT